MKQILSQSQQSIDMMNAYLDSVQRRIDKHYETKGNQVPKPIHKMTDKECREETEKLTALITEIASEAELITKYGQFLFFDTAI